MSHRCESKGTTVAILKQACGNQPIIAATIHYSAFCDE